MTPESFRQILHSLGEQVNTLLLYYMGEPFLCKGVYQMISHAAQKGLYVSVCTNGELLDPHALIESGVSEVSFQIGGLSQLTHEQYRVGGNLNKTLENLAETVRIKRQRQARTRIIVGFIVMKHNEHEIAEVAKLGGELGVTVQAISPCVRNIEQGDQYLPESDRYWYYDRESFKQGVLRPRKKPHNRCWWIYYSTVITWDGFVVPCCRDAQADYVMGNVLEQDFKEIWNGEPYKNFRRKIREQQDQVGLCRLCSGYGIARLY